LTLIFTLWASGPTILIFFATDDTPIFLDYILWRSLASRAHDRETGSEPALQRF
jgi:hypothetical protein